jgi:two-component system, NarL family, nitrate/nitrite response regulator NarL
MRKRLTFFMELLTVLIISSDPLTRAGLASILRNGNLHILEASPSDDLTVWHDANAIVWDGEPDDELETDLPILALLEDGTRVKRVLQQARAVLGRSASAEQMVATLQAITQGLVVVERTFLETLPLSETSDTPLPEHLTQRELEVLRHLAEGLSNKAIAKRLEISENTVKFHVNALLEKFEVGSRTEVVIRAIQNGLVTI